MTTNTIILNPEEALKLDYLKWKDLISFESYLMLIAQREHYDRNAKGQERVKTMANV